MAADLNITPSAYSKIERGITDPSIGRLEQIAKILGVDVTYFFQEAGDPLKMEDTDKVYGFATKGDIEELNKIINQLKQEIALLKKDILTLHAGTGQIKRKK